MKFRIFWFWIWTKCDGTLKFLIEFFKEHLYINLGMCFITYKIVIAFLTACDFVHLDFLSLLPNHIYYITVHISHLACAIFGVSLNKCITECDFSYAYMHGISRSTWLSRNRILPKVPNKIHSQLQYVYSILNERFNFSWLT